MLTSGVMGISHQLPFYFSGILHDRKCSNTTVNHVVLVVGYGSEGEETDGKKYWLVKNRYGLPNIKQTYM